MVAGGAAPPRPPGSPTAGARYGEGDLPEAVPVHDGFGIGHPGTVTGHPDPQRGRLHGAPHGGFQQQRLAVDPDRDLGGVGVDHDLTAGQPGDPARLGPADQAGRLGRAGDRDREHPQDAAVQPGPAAKAGDVAHPVLLLLTRTAWGASTVTFSALATSRGPSWPASSPGSW